MGFEILRPGDPRLRGGPDKPDRILEHQLASIARQDPSSRMTSTKVPVQDPADRAKTVEVVVRYPYDEQFAFVTYGDNVPLQSRPQDEWRALARSALQKIAAMAKLRIKDGPKNEEGSEFDYKVELTEPLEWSPEALIERKRHQEEQKKRQERLAMLQELGLV